MNILKEHDADALILNGDIAGEQFCQAYNREYNHQHRYCDHPPKTLDEKHYIAELLHAAAATGLEIYVQPGSHEELDHFDPPVQVLSAYYGNITNVLENPKIDKGDHHLVFLPGSDVSAGNTMLSGYHLVENMDEGSGYYDINGPQGNGKVRITAMDELRRHVTEPERTIVISHIPPHFSGLEHAIDRAEFGEAVQDFPQGQELIKKGTIIAPLPAAEQLRAHGYPVRIRKENRGNKHLRALYDELGITKAVCGHLHESVHRAHDRAGNPVEEETPVTELFWNASHLDVLKVGLLSVHDTKVAYENVDLRRFVEGSQ